MKNLNSLLTSNGVEGEEIMKNITLDYTIETSYEDGTFWAGYTVGDRISFEILTEEQEAELTEQEKIELTAKRLHEKLDINQCSEKLRELINECRYSDNDMWFVEEGEIEPEELEAISEEIANLPEDLQEYFEIESWGVELTIYGGVITEFLF